MCGIAGFWNKGGRPACPDIINKMRDTLIHRGPDAGESYIDGDLALGHRRLSILDLSESANQPYHSPCGRYHLVYNGEIFNYQDFYAELKLKGYTFQTTSDTEVLLYLLMAYGLKVLPRLNGFFAFALWDNKERKLTLVRDRFGVKPLYWAETDNGLVFGSEPKSLFPYGLQKSIDESHLDELFFYRHVSGINTIFKDVMRFLPGYYQIWKDGVVLEQETQWYHLGEEAKATSLISNPKEWYEETFLDAVRLRMISDVPVGTMLSGGLDSSSVLYAQHHLKYQNLSSWNLRFSNYEKDESSLAIRISEEYDVEYNGYEFLGEELADLTTGIMQISDEPTMHFTDGVLLGLSKQAKKKVSVLLTGEGADETLAGYVRHKVFGDDFRYTLLQILRYTPEKWLKVERIKKMKRYLAEPNVDFQLMTNANELYLNDLSKLGLNFINILPKYRIEKLEEAKKYYPKNRLRQLLYLEMHTHLCSLNDKNDRTTMGASIECREPFLDYRLVNGLFSLDSKYFPTTGKGKWLSMNTVGKRLPHYIQNHEKVGLAIPWPKYFMENPTFRDHLENMHENPFFKIGWLRHLDVKKAVTEFKKDPKNNYPIIRSLFFNSFWYNTQFGNSN